MFKRIVTGIDLILNWIETCFLTLCFSAMLIIIVAQMVMQGAFKISMPWAVQAALYLMMWLICFGSSAAARAGAHIAFETLGRILPASIIRLISRIVCAASSAFCAAGAIMGYTFMIESKKLGTATAVMNLPLWIMYSALPISAVMIAVRFALLVFIDPVAEKPSEAEASS